MNETQDQKEMNFEQALAALEKTVEKMNNPDASLDEMIVLYEQGLQFLRLCQKNVEAAEMKITQLDARLKEQLENGKENG